MGWWDGVWQLSAVSDLLKYQIRESEPGNLGLKAFAEQALILVCDAEAFGLGREELWGLYGVGQGVMLLGEFGCQPHPNIPSFIAGFRICSHRGSGAFQKAGTIHRIFLSLWGRFVFTESPCCYPKVWNLSTVPFVYQGSEEFGSFGSVFETFGHCRSTNLCSEFQKLKCCNGNRKHWIRACNPVIKNACLKKLLYCE